MNYLRNSRVFVKQKCFSDCDEEVAAAHRCVIFNLYPYNET